METEREPAAIVVAEKKEMLRKMFREAEPGRAGGFFGSDGKTLNTAAEQLLSAILECVRKEVNSGEVPGEEGA